MVRVIGGGPAGAAAAIAALGAGEDVEIYEQEPVPRRKVCGEFLAPGTLAELRRLGVFEACTAARPARVERLIVNIGSCRRQARLRETAWGLSRRRLESILLDRAAALGARVIPERRTPGERDVAATGRPPGEMVGRYGNLYGFQAHFRGGGGDAAEMFFFQFGCVGMHAVEDGLVSVCGLVSQALLREHGSEPDRLLASRPLPAARIRWLKRVTDWAITGPVVISDEVDWPQTGPYPAGDALAAAEAFTGSGILNALITGRMAGTAAARGTTVREYSRRVEKLLGWRLLAGYAIATELDTGWARILAPVAPVGWLFRLTQPSASEE